MSNKRKRKVNEIRDASWQPTDKEIQQLIDCGWSRPDPKVPNALWDLISPPFLNALQIVTGEHATRTEKQYIESIIEAYRRGKEAKSAK